MMSVRPWHGWHSTAALHRHNFHMTGLPYMMSEYIYFYLDYFVHLVWLVVGQTHIAVTQRGGCHLTGLKHNTVTSLRHSQGSLFQANSRSPLILSFFSRGVQGIERRLTKRCIQSFTLFSILQFSNKQMRKGKTRKS